ncbi:MAG: ATP-binding protein [Myxococcales bacterium]|nr:ATP-binding protein [Myxococcales bacterium]MDH3485123.1 ATP-binding protein [Myxococcales bacterium]
MGGLRKEPAEWGRGAAPSDETVAARIRLNPEQRRGMLNSVTGHHIGTMTACAGFAYVGIALGQWSQSMDEAAVALMAVYGLTGIALLAFSLRTKHQPLPIDWSIHVAGVVFVIITSTMTVGYVISRDPSMFYFFVILQFAAGALLQSRTWLLVTMVCADIGWGVTSLFIEDVNWMQSVGYLAGFSVVAIGTHVVRRRTLVELHELRVAAERASETKTEFLANMSHEVRTPMTGVLGLGSLLLETKLDPKQQKMAAAIRDSAEALVGVVDEILDFSRLEKGQIELERVPFDLEVLIDGVVELMQPRAKEKGLRLASELDGLTRSRFVGDGGRLRQVLLNFANNAIKFTESGSVLIEARMLEKAAQCRVRISVRDTGIGIPDEAIDKIFTRYQQQDPSTSRCFGGTGLGLAISKQLVELMGGELGVESKVDEGTTFWVEVELEPGSEDTLRLKGTPGVGDQLIRRGLKVLLAEDNPTSRMVTEALLKKLACDVDIATDGRMALEKARTARYDIIFMDCYMPQMNGFQATRRIREHPANREVPVIALTASTTDGDRVRCLEAGMSDTIGKPVRSSMLETLFKRWVSLSHEPPVVVPSMKSPPPSALDMNMVRQLVSLDEEDDGFIEEVMVGYIEQLRESVVTLRDALEASDMETVRLTAHSIKGASKQLGASRVGELLGAIEREEAVEPARDLVGQVAEEIPRVEEAVQALLRRHAS